MKTARQIRIAFTLTSTILAGLLIAVLSYSSTTSQAQPVALAAPAQVVVISAKKWSVAEKLHYDTLAAVGVENETANALPSPMQTVVISAKRLTTEQKIAIDAARSRQLQANTQYNTLLRKTV